MIRSNQDNAGPNFDSTQTPLYTITASSVERSGSSVSGGALLIGSADDVKVNYSNVGLLFINGGPNGNTFNVQSTALGTSTTINAGAGGDAIDVSETVLQWAGVLPGLAGSLMVNGDSKTTTLLLDDLNVLGATLPVGGNLVTYLYRAQHLHDELGIHPPH